MKKTFLFSLFLCALISISIFGNTPHDSQAQTMQPTAWNQTFDTKEQNIWINLPHEANVLSAEIPKNKSIWVQFPQSEWIQLQNAHSHQGEEFPEIPDFASTDTWSELVFADQPFRTFQFRIEPQSIQESNTATSKIERQNSQIQDPYSIPFSFLNPQLSQAPIQASTHTVISGGTSELDIISRREWGADESIRYSESSASVDETDAPENNKDSGRHRIKGCNDAHLLYPDEFEVSQVIHTENGNELKWPLQYSEKIEKFFVHHTASIPDDRDPKEIMRAIYSYHAISRGWGDIGYNYVIDPNGRIYEGRAGGDYVIGGHVQCANAQTMGIALMGNFQEQSPSDQQLAALGGLIKVLAQKYELDPSASSKFHGKDLPNLLGHRDMGQTACPGQNMYDLLDQLRILLRKTDVVQRLKEINRSAEFTGTVEFIQLNPGAETTATFTFKNTGNVTWDRDTWLYVVNPLRGVKARSKRPPKTYIAALMKEPRVLPGQTATFTVDIQADFDGGLYSLAFNPVVKGRKISNAEIVQPIEVIPPEWGARLNRNQVKTEPKIPLVGDRVSMSIPIRNTGDTRWRNEHVTLQLQWGQKTYTGSLRERNILPGQTGHFAISLDPFETKRRYILRPKLLVDERPMRGVRLPGILLNVGEAEYKSRLLSPRISRLSPSSDGVVQTQVQIMNNGNISWDKDEITLFVRGSGKEYSFSPNQNTIPPKEIAEFDISFTPHKRGVLRYSLSLNRGSQKIYGIPSNRIIVRNQQTPQAQNTPTQQTRPIPRPTRTTRSNTRPIIDNPIRIRLEYPHQDAQIFNSQDFEIWGDNRLIGTVGQKRSISISPDQSNVKINGTSYNTLRLIPQNTRGIFTISSWDRKPAWTDTYNDNQFRGILEIRVWNGELIVINELELEHYIQGIAEVSNTAPTEKKKVIAVLARSYAAFYMRPENEKFSGAPYHLDDSPERSQKYRGYGYELRSPDFVNAAQNTKNLVVTYQGTLIKTPYFSQSDGRTRSAEEVWGWTDTPYLQSVDDPLCPEKELKGHGVGLSGCGATEAAKLGKTYQEIIQYYYQGVEIEPLP